MDKLNYQLWVRFSFKRALRNDGHVLLFIGDAVQETPRWLTKACCELNDENLTIMMFDGVQVIPWTRINLVSDKFVFRTDMADGCYYQS